MSTPESTRATLAASCFRGLAEANAALDADRHPSGCVLMLDDSSMVLVATPTQYHLAVPRGDLVGAMVWTDADAAAFAERWNAAGHPPVTAVPYAVAVRRYRDHLIDFLKALI